MPDWEGIWNIEEKPPLALQLGKAGSPAYLDGVASVLRRTQIEGLSRAIQTLKSGLMDLADEMEKTQKK